LTVVSQLWNRFCSTGEVMDNIQNNTMHKTVLSKNVAILMQLSMGLLLLATLLSFAILRASDDPFLPAGLLGLILLLLTVDFVVFVIILFFTSSARYIILICLWFTVWLIIFNLTIIMKVPNLQERLSIEEDRQVVLLAALRVEDFRKNTGQYPNSKEEFIKLFQNELTANDDFASLSYYYDDRNNAYIITKFHGYGPHLSYDSNKSKIFEEYY
jgi:hypothetical protein